MLIFAVLIADTATKTAKKIEVGEKNPLNCALLVKTATINGVDFSALVSVYNHYALNHRLMIIHI